MKIVTQMFFVFAVAASLFFASWFVQHNNIYFYGDLARDFLLFEEIVQEKKPVLIGPRTSMQGVFHGPLWLYMNVPAFFIGEGDPVTVGWFWVLLIAASIVIVYLSARQLGSGSSALIATVLYALTVAVTAPYLYNPFGAVMCAPLFFLFFVRYMQKHKVVDLVLTLFFVGLSIQFEMVWGVPMLTLASIMIIYAIFKKKNFLHLLSFGILSIPLSTFILFDLRHDFIQAKAFLRYVLGDPGAVKQKVDYLSLLISRIKDMVLVMPSYFSQGNFKLQIAFAILFFLAVAFFLRSKIKKKTSLVGYFLYFYIGFWVLTLPLKGVVYEYYYWAFLPLFCIVIGTLAETLSKKYGTFLIAPLVIFLIVANIQTIQKQDAKFFKNNTALWSFYNGQAQSIFRNAEEEFGWFVYTADQYAYPFKYAMSYAARIYPEVRSYKFQKKLITYLMIYPSDNKYTNEAWWREGQLKIKKQPRSISKSIGGSYIEKYYFSVQDAGVPVDSSLLDDLRFR